MLLELHCAIAHEPRGPEKDDSYSKDERAGRVVTLSRRSVRQVPKARLARPSLTSQSSVQAALPISLGPAKGLPNAESLVAKKRSLRSSPRRFRAVSASRDNTEVNRCGIS